jgi:hypothetical protein
VNPPGYKASKPPPSECSIPSRVARDSRAELRYVHHKEGVGPLAFVAVIAVFFLLPGVLYALSRQLKGWRSITVTEQALAVLTLIGLTTAVMALVGLAALG